MSQYQTATPSTLDPEKYLDPHLSTTLLSTLTSDVLGVILQFSEIGFNGTRLAYLKGSPVCKAMWLDIWWKDYWYGNWGETWVEWCQHRMIIGPPRFRGPREICGYDEDYILMDGKDYKRHYEPWMKTWPESSDHSWCKARQENIIPDWAKLDYCQN